MKKVFIYLVLQFIAFVSFAVSERTIESCRLSAYFNQDYGRLMDLKFQLFSEEKKNLSLDQIKIYLGKMQNEHENYKDRRYKELRDYYDKKIHNKEIDMIDAEAERMILEAGIDAAHVIAGENYMNSNLDRPIEHYFRKIFDDCVLRK